MSKSLKHSDNNTMISAMSELKIASQFNDFYRDNFFLLGKEEVNDRNIRAILVKLLALGEALNSFLDLWIDSKSSGSDAIIGELDTELLQNSTLDMELFGKIINRLKHLEVCLMVVYRSEIYLEDFHEKCIQAGAGRDIVEPILKIRIVFKTVTEDLEEEKQSLTNLVERCNLFYQSLTIGHLDKDLMDLRKDMESLNSSTKEIGVISDSMKRTMHEDVMKLGEETEKLDNHVKELGKTSEKILGSSENVVRLTRALILLTLGLAVIAFVELISPDLIGNSPIKWFFVGVGLFVVSLLIYMSLKYLLS